MSFIIFRHFAPRESFGDAIYTVSKFCFFVMMSFAKFYKSISMRSFDNVIYKVGKFRTQKLLGWCHLKGMDISHTYTVLVGSFTQFGNFAPSGGFDHAIYKVWKFSTHILHWWHFFFTKFAIFARIGCCDYVIYNIWKLRAEVWDIKYNLQNISIIMFTIIITAILVNMCVSWKTLC